jgi:hypothetical protein
MRDMPPETATETPAAAPATPPQAAPAAPPAPAQSADISLFEGVDATASDTAAPAAPAAPSAPGARPDFIPEQFWDPASNQPRIEAMAKSWRDLRAKVSQGIGTTPENPDSYAFPKIEGLTEELVKPDDPLWKQVRESAHEAGVTQQQLEAIISPYIQDALQRGKQQPAASPEEDAAARQAARAAELGKLGPNGDLMVRDIKGWITGLQSRGGLTDAEAQALMTAGSADGIRALAKLRALAGEKPIPLDSLAGADMTTAEARALMIQGNIEKRAGQASGDEKISRARRALEGLEKRGLLNV